MTHSCVWHDSGLMAHGSFIRVWHDSFDRCRAEQAQVAHSPAWPLCSPVDRHNGGCDMPHSDLTCLIHMWHEPFICDFAPLLASGPAQWRVWHASFRFDMPHPYVTCLIHTWHASSIRDMPHSYVTCRMHLWHASQVNRHKRQRRPINMKWDLQKRPTYVWRDFQKTDVTCLVMRDMPLPYVTWLIHTWYDSFMCVWGGHA